MKLTIVLTIFNKEPFLRKALDAILNQEYVSHNDYELLAVNDGSTDGSEQIIEEYAASFHNVHILTQENQGLSIARNNGVNAACGEYVWFVDADDTIASKSVYLILKAIDNKPDIIPIYANTDGIDYIRNAVSRKAKTGKDILNEGKWEHCGVFYIIRKEFLLQNSISFLPGIYHEDAEFTPRVLYYADKVEVIPQILYTVFRDPNSITQVPKAKRAFDYLTVADKLYRFTVENGERNTDIGKKMFTNIAVIINMAFYIIVQNKCDDQKKFNMEYYNKKEILNDSLNIAGGKKYGIESFLFKLFPYQYVKVYKFLKLFG